MGLANEELRQHDSYGTRVGLDPLVDPSARVRFRALCYRQSSARISHALAIESPRLPSSASLLRRRCPSLPQCRDHSLPEISLTPLILCHLSSLLPTLFPFPCLVSAFLFPSLKAPRPASLSGVIHMCVARLSLHNRGRPSDIDVFPKTQFANLNTKRLYK
jgi:hypothetical protein